MNPSMLSPRSILGRVFVLLLFCLATLSWAEKPRVIIMSDIGGTEPDDQESFVRLLLYSNELDLVGLIGANSRFGANRGDITVFANIINVYAQVLPNLQVHASGYPDPAYLQSIRRDGQKGLIGMAGVGSGRSTPGSQLIIDELLKPDPRPVWLLAWGGISTLAQALWDLQAQGLPPAQLDALVAKIRVYDIAGQDDSGAWIAHTFPDIFYVRSGNQFMSFSYRADWQGQPQQDGDLSVVDFGWFLANVRANHLPYGGQYPNARYMYEGDTPSFLYLLDNGLHDPEQPHQGSWGGRFTRDKVSPPDIYMNGTDNSYPPAYMFINDSDTYLFQGTVYDTIFTPLWRWRYEYQNDFAARMDWTLTSDFGAVNHEPAAVVNGDGTTEVLSYTVNPGQSFALNGSASSDPDGDELTFTWWNYPEAGTYGTPLTVPSPNSSNTTFPVPGDLAPGETIHLILSLKDNGNPALTSYRRVVLIGSGSPVDQPPVAEAGPDRALTLPANSLTLEGNAADDFGISAVAWSFVSGPFDPPKSGANTLSLQLSGLTEGVFVFALEVFDTIGQSDTDTVAVTVSPTPNTPPVVNAGPDQTIQLPLNSTSLAGTATDDTGVASVLWTQLSGPSTATLSGATALTPGVSNLIAGTYQFRLRATDLNGAQSSDEVSLIVLPAGGGGETVLFAINCGGPAHHGTDDNIDYAADAYFSGGSVGTKGGGIGLTTDPELFLQYRYRMASYDLPIPTPGTVNVRLRMAEIYFSSAGSRVFDIFAEGQLIADNFDILATAGGQRRAYDLEFATTVTDGTLNLVFTAEENLALLSALVVTTSGAPVDAPPVVQLTAPAEGATFRVGDDIAVTADASDDSAVTEVRFSWDGSLVSTDPTAPYAVLLANATAGTHQITAVAEDDAAQTASDSRTVTVVANQPPSVDAGADLFITQPASSASLAATVADDDGIASILWLQDSGPATASFGDASAPSTTVAGLTAAGTYGFRIQVVDTDGAVAEDTVAVTVQTSTPVTQIGLNLNGGTFTDTDGVDYASATPFLTGGYGGTKSWDYAGTADQNNALYNTYWLGDFGLAVPVPNGNYTVTLRLAEVYWGGSGQRVFNVLAEGALAAQNVDIVALAGGSRAVYDLDLTVNVTDGELNLDFVTVVNNSLLNALIITPAP